MQYTKPFTPFPFVKEDEVFVLRRGMCKTASSLLGCCAAKRTPADETVPSPFTSWPPYIAGACLGF